MARERTAYYSDHPELIAGLKKAAPVELEDDKSAAGEWFKLWLADRVARGYTSTSDNASHWRIHIRPVFGSGGPKTWTRDTFHKLSAQLDAKVQGAEMSWATAVNIWSTATKMANDAAESKQSKIRVREDDPAQGVKGPDVGDDVGKQFLYPAEFLKFANHPEVPQRWKWIVVLAIYSYLRDGELRVLECRDDTKHGVIRVTKALDRRTWKTGSPKGGRSRDVPIEPTLAPLLKVMKAELDESGALVPRSEFPSVRDMARGLRRWLKRAGVDRHELHHRTR